MLKVLLVEDDKIIQMVHQKLLSLLGCEVHVAERGDIALEMSKDHYDLIFMDIGLPRMSGLEVIKRIRERDDATSKVYIIVVTSFTADENKKDFLAAGANVIVAKPLEVEWLREVLAQHENTH